MQYFVQLGEIICHNLSTNAGIVVFLWGGFLFLVVFFFGSAAQTREEFNIVPRFQTLNFTFETKEARAGLILGYSSGAIIIASVKLAFNTRQLLES